MSIVFASGRPVQQAAPPQEQPPRQTPGIHISPRLQERMRCPACGSPLLISPKCRTCRHNHCAKHFRVIDGVPVLIDEESSVFSLRQALSRYPPPPATWRRRLFQGVRRRVPTLGASPLASKNLEQFRRLLRERGSRPCVLVIGGAWLGCGMDTLLGDPRIETVESDIWLSERTHLLCDALQIPFADGTFDGVVVQAVLEHVADPERCVREVHRVLQPGGLVYAETAFLQQVHAGRHDFTRFTPVGHRRLFRSFEQIAGGAAAGPAVALAWAWQHFLLSFAGSSLGRIAATLVGAFTAFWLKYWDRYLLDRPAALDAASAVFFLGARREFSLTDREVIAAYPGAQHDVV